MSAAGRLGLWVRRGLLVALLASVVAPAQAATQRTELLALCYHDVVTDPARTLVDPMSITVDTLVSHLSWLAGNGYRPISLAQWRQAQRGGELPGKAVLLTFDDGYSSFHQHVLPLLELFQMPAVLAPVTRWIDTPADQPVEYGEERRARADFLNWGQLREIADSALVEFASHSHDLHRGVVANPQGNLLPAAAAHRHLSGRGYETDAAYRERVRADLQTSVELLREHTGRTPDAIVWPYGAHNELARAAAQSAGMDLSLSLGDALNVAGNRVIHRVLVDADTDLAALAATAQAAFGERPVPPRPLRAAHVDLDYVYDADPVQQEANLDVLLDRIKDLQINTVFLQAFADADGDGVAEAMYFPNRHMPLRADLFSRVAWQLNTRAGVRVFAWMPVLAFRLPEPRLNEQLAVTTADQTDDPGYHRLSPYLPQARRIISEIYDDLGRSSLFAGVLFNDDAFLAEAEGAGSPAAKTATLVELTGELSQVLRRWQPDLRTARNLYARVLTNPDSEAWFAQNYADFLQHYDYTAVMAMPYLEDARRPQQWLEQLLSSAQAYGPQALGRTIFHLQAKDWRSGRAVPDQQLAAQFDLLLRRGALNIAYYPDDFIANHPDLAMVRSRLSVNTHPALKR